MYQLFISLRYLRKRITAAGAILAVTFGVATLLIVLSIFQGYITRLREMIRDKDAHLMVQGSSPVSLCDIEALQAKILEIPHVIAAAPTIETLAMYGSGKFTPCLLRGVDPEREFQVTGMGSKLLRPEEIEEILAAGSNGAPGEPGSGDAREGKGREIFRSRAPVQEAEARELAGALFSLSHRERLFDRENPGLAGRFRELGAPSAVIVGAPLLINRELNLGQLVKIFTLAPRTSKPVDGTFVIAGAFMTGSFEVDSRIFLVSINRMKTFVGTFNPELNAECYGGIRIALDDYRHARKAKEAINDLLSKQPPGSGAERAVVSTWEEHRRPFLQAVAIEKWINGIVVSFLNLFTGCIILLMLVLLVIEKTRDAGVLLALGATPSGVFAIFLLDGMVITVLGAGFGLGIGLLFVDFINPIHDAIFHLTGIRLFDPEVYMMDSIPTEVIPFDVAISTLPALAFGLLASLVPAIWASLKDPIQAIHYE